MGSVPLLSVDDEEQEAIARLVGARLGAAPLGAQRTFSGYRSRESTEFDCVVRVRLLGARRRIQGVSVEITNGAFVREVRYAEFLIAPRSEGVNLTLGALPQNPLAVATQFSHRHGSSIWNLIVTRTRVGARVEITESSRDGYPMLRVACGGFEITPGAL